MDRLIENFKERLSSYVKDEKELGELVKLSEKYSAEAAFSDDVSEDTLNDFAEETYSICDRYRESSKRDEDYSGQVIDDFFNIVKVEK